jgi:hypothetical protein
MSATLNSGIKAVHLVLSRPTYTRPNNTTDTRDDLVSVKVWYSKVTPFDPTAAYNAVSNPWVLYSDNGGLLTTIDGLEEDTTYYVKYAYVSKIDPDAITVSSQLSAKTLAAGVHVYGYLSNDPVNISTDSAGTILVTVNGVLVASPTSTQQQAAWTTASQGVFKVYNDNAEVTGANTTNILASDGSVVGPRYSIKAGSYTGDLTSSNTFIDSITGAFYSTGVGVTNYNNSVIFLAKYNGVTVERTWTVTKGRGGQTAPLIQLSANTTEFVYKQEIDTTSVTASAVIKARLANITGQIAWLAYAYTRSGSLLGAVSGTQDQVNNTFTITAAQFGYYGVTTGYVLATATSVSDNTISDTITLYRINDGSNQITVEQTNGSHLITANALGNTTYNDYDGSGNTITVKKGNKTLLIDNTSSDNFSTDTWRIVSVVPSKNTSNVDTISYDASYVATQGSTQAIFSRASNMIADVAYIDYTIRVQQIAGTGSDSTQYLDTTVRQSFAKSKAGATGRGVNLTSNYANFTTASGSSTVLPSTIALTATTSQYTNPQYQWTIDGSTTFASSVATVSNNVLTLKSFASGNPVPAKLIRVTVSETINGITYEQFDELSIASLKEGDPGISYNLTNGNQTIYYDSTGTIKAGQLDVTLNTTTPPYFKCVYQVKRGTTSLNSTGAVTFSLAASSGMTADINTSTGVISVATLTSEFASATFYATVDGQVYTQVLTLNRSQDGASAPNINLTGLKTIAFVKSVDNVWSPNTIILNADTFNIPLNTTYYWYEAVNDGAFTFITSGVDLKQYTLSQFTSGTKSYKIQATVNGQLVYDVQTVYSLESGSGGLAIGLANPSQNISSSATGVPVSGTSITTTLLVYKGTDRVTTGLTFSAISYSGLSASGIANYTSTINSSGDITVPSSYLDQGSGVNQITITYRVTGTNIDASRILTINKTRDGATGNSIYVATVYKQSASNPGSPGSTGPTGGSYNFSNNYLTAPSGWSATQPATTTTPTWACDYTFVGAPTATITASQWSDVYVEAQNGTNGEYRDIVELYLISPTQPTAPTSATYYFSNNTISTSGGSSGWGLTQPQTTTTPTWMIKALATTTTPDIGVSLTTWTSPIIVAQNGINGTNGTNTAQVALYAVFSSSILYPALPSGTFVYTFSNGNLSPKSGTSSTLGNWTQSVPTVGLNQYLWSIYAVAASNTSSDEISSSEFSSPVVSSSGGTAGINTATVTLYNKNTSSTSAPASFYGTFGYQFNTGVLSLGEQGSTFNNWSQTPPTLVKGEYLWARYAVASSTNVGDELLSSEFSAAVVVGVAGTDGINGSSISVQYAATNSSTNSDWHSDFRATDLYIRIVTTSSTGSVSYGAGSLIKATDGTSTKVEYSSAASGATWYTTPQADSKYIKISIVKSDGTVVTEGTPTKYVGADGTPGTSTYTATIYLYSSSYPTTLSAPPAPYGGVYTFSTGVLQPPGGGWLITQPDSDIYPTWAATYTFTTTTPTISTLGYTWTNVRAIAVKGAASTIPGPRNASGYLYYQRSLATTDAVPTKPNPSGWSWTTGTFSSPGTTDGYSWSTSPFTPSAGQVAYASRYYVTETTYGGTTNVSTDNAVTNITFNGLVTFTDLNLKADSNSITGTANTAITNSISSGTIKTALDTKIGTTEGDKVATAINSYRSPTTTINGGVIETGSINANQLVIGGLNRSGARIEMTNTSMIVYSDGTSTYPNGVKRVIIGYLG